MSKKSFVVFAGICLCVFTVFATNGSTKEKLAEKSVSVEKTKETDNDKASDKAKSEEEIGADLYSQIELFSYTLTTIQSEYVDEKQPKDLIYGALDGMLGALDPHSQFLSPEAYEELKTETRGSFGGLGIEISIRDGLLTIVTPIEDTPAWRAGLMAGDKIVKIEEELTRDMSLDDAVKLMRGEPNTDINITILREEEYEIKEYTITREIIHIQDVKDVHMIKDDVGYIRLTEFREDSAKDFRKGLEQLEADGAKSLIVDLRNNPGGLLNVAIKISEEFLEAGQTIVSTRGRRVSQNSVTKSRNLEPVVHDWPIVVLINKGSASGSEILAGALKDNKRAVILGEQSFGKGSVQSVIPLPDGSGLRLTTAKYFTPSGVSIHEIGIEPDIKVKRIYPKKDEEEEKDVKKKNLEEIFETVKGKDAEDPNEVERLKKIEDRDKRLAEDNQVQAAINVLKGIRVYQMLTSDEPVAVPATDTADTATE